MAVIDHGISELLATPLGDARADPDLCRCQSARLATGHPDRRGRRRSPLGGDRYARSRRARRLAARLDHRADRPDARTRPATLDDVSLRTDRLLIDGEERPVTLPDVNGTGLATRVFKQATLNNDIDGVASMLPDNSDEPKGWRDLAALLPDYRVGPRRRRRHDHDDRVAADGGTRLGSGSRAVHREPRRQDEHRPHQVRQQLRRGPADQARTDVAIGQARVHQSSRSGRVAAWRTHQRADSGRGSFEWHVRCFTRRVHAQRRRVGADDPAQVPRRTRWVWATSSPSRCSRWSCCGGSNTGDRLDESAGKSTRIPCLSREHQSRTRRHRFGVRPPPVRGR